MGKIIYHTCYIQVEGNGVELPRIAHDLSSHPLQPIGPVDQVQMAHSHQRPLVPLVTSPATAVHADKTIIGPLCFGQDPVGETEDRPDAGLYCCAIREISAR